MLRVGVIGYGYWGPNIVRNFNSASGSKVVKVCDCNTDALKRLNKIYPDIPVTPDSGDLICSGDADVVAIATPVFTHYELAKKALLKVNTSSSRSLSPTRPNRRKS